MIALYALPFQRSRLPLLSYTQLYLPPLSRVSSGPLPPDRVRDFPRSNSGLPFRNPLWYPKSFLPDFLCCRIVSKVFLRPFIGSSRRRSLTGPPLVYTLSLSFCLLTPSFTQSKGFWLFYLLPPNSLINYCDLGSDNRLLLSGLPRHCPPCFGALL